MLPRRGGPRCARRPLGCASRGAALRAEGAYTSASSRSAVESGSGDSNASSARRSMCALNAARMSSRSSARDRALGEQARLEARDGILRRPLLEQVLRHVGGAGGLLVAAHPEGLELQERRSLAAPRPLRRAAHRIDHRQHVVAIDRLAGHPVADRAIRQPRAGVLLDDGRRQAPLVVLDDEDHRQLPDRGEVQRFVEVALARRAFSGEGRRHARLAAQLIREGQPVGHRQHRAQVADHPDDVVREDAEMERAVAAAGEAAVAAQQLAEERQQIQPAGGEDPQIPVHREDGIVRPQGGGDADRDGLLPDAGEPLGQPSLPQQDQHLFLDQPRKQQRAVERPLPLGVERRRRAPRRWTRTEAGWLGRAWRDYLRLQAPATDFRVPAASCPAANDGNRSRAYGCAAGLADYNPVVSHAADRRNCGNRAPIGAIRRRSMPTIRAARRKRSAGCRR